jgi:hypothetical protein
MKKSTKINFNTRYESLLTDMGIRKVTPFTPKPLETKFDIILDWYINGNEKDELPLSLHKQLERWEFIDNLINNYVNVSDPYEDRPASLNNTYLANLVMERFDCSRSAAFRYIKDSQYFFGKAHKFHNNYIRMVLFNNGMNALRKLILKKDYVNAITGIEKLAKSLGLDREDPDTAYFQQFIRNEYNLLLHVNNKYYRYNMDKLDELDTDTLDCIILIMRELIEIDFEDVQ